MVELLRPAVEKVGRLDKALGEAAQRGWTVVDMARDWKTGFAFERGSAGAYPF
jgi:hypothetical protein